jgi:hypothetical protein
MATLPILNLLKHKEPTSFGSSGHREMEYRYFFVGDIGFKRKAQALYLVERQCSSPMPGRLTEFQTALLSYTIQSTE